MLEDTPAGSGVHAMSIRLGDFERDSVCGLVEGKKVAASNDAGGNLVVSVKAMPANRLRLV
jgi:hypothetical protein